MSLNVSHKIWMDFSVVLPEILKIAPKENETFTLTHDVAASHFFFFPLFNPPKTEIISHFHLLSAICFLSFVQSSQYLCVLLTWLVYFHLLFGQVFSSSLGFGNSLHICPTFVVSSFVADQLLDSTTVMFCLVKEKDESFDL